MQRLTLQGLSVCALALCSMTSLADIQLSSSINNSATLGRHGEISDISGGATPARQLFEDIHPQKAAIVRRIEWLGDAFPTNIDYSNAVFQISFHRSDDLPPSSLINHRPQLTPFASFVVRPDIIAENVGANANDTRFSANLEAEFMLPSEPRLWLSVTLISPALSTAEGNNAVAWQWTEANALGVHVAYDYSSGEFTTPSGDLHFALHGIYYSTPQIDIDQDGVFDEYDSCPGTALGAAVDDEGCTPAQRDSDGDGFSDDIDRCIISAAGETLDASGCTASQTDMDRDGVLDAWDDCPASPEGNLVDGEGCAAGQARFATVFNSNELTHASDLLAASASSDIHHPAVTYGEFAFLQNTVVQQVSFVGTALSDAELQSGADFNVSFHIAYPEAPTTPWEFPLLYNRVHTASASDTFWVNINGTPTAMREYTLTLDNPVTLNRNRFHWLAVRHAGSAATPEAWQWLTNQLNTCCSAFGSSTTARPQALNQSPVFTLRAPQ